MNTVAPDTTVSHMRQLNRSALFFFLTNNPLQKKKERKKGFTKGQNIAFCRDLDTVQKNNVGCLCVFMVATITQTDYMLVCQSYLSTKLTFWPPICRSWLVRLE